MRHNLSRSRTPARDQDKKIQPAPVTLLLSSFSDITLEIEEEKVGRDAGLETLITHGLDWVWEKSKRAMGVGIAE